MTQNNEAHMITANALTKKRADLLFEISEGEKRIERMRTELVHLDAVLRMFRPDFAAADLPVRHRRPTKSPYFAHGELTQRIYDGLRELGGECTSADIAEKAMRDKGLEPRSDHATRTDFVRRVTMQFREMVRDGHVIKVGGRGPVARWRVSKEV